MKSRFTAILAAAVAAVLTLCASASADIRIFKVTAEGSGTYARTDDSRGQFGLGHEEFVSVGFDWRVVFPRLAFDSVGGALTPGVIPPQGKINGEGERYFMNHGESGGQPVKTPGFCQARGASAPARGGRFQLDPAAPAGGELGAHLLFRPFDELKLPAQCDGALVNFPHLSVWDGSDPANAFESAFFMPKEATDQGKVIQLLEQTPAQKAACALREPWTKSCTLEWSGKLTFELIDVIKVTPHRPGDDLDDIVLPLPGEDEVKVRRRGKLAPNGSKASVDVTCPSGCRGTVRAYPAAARASGARALATKRFKVRGGAKVTLRFKGAARRMVRRTGAVTLVVSVGGDTHVAIARRRR